MEENQIGTDCSCVSFLTHFIYTFYLVCRELSSTSRNFKQRLQGAGRKLKDGEADQELKEWVLDQRRQKIKVTRKMIQDKAKTLFDDENFKVKHGFHKYYPLSV